VVLLVGRPKRGSRINAQRMGATHARVEKQEKEKEHKQRCDYIIKRVKPHGKGKFKDREVYGALISLFFKLYQRKVPEDNNNAWWNKCINETANLLSVERRLVRDRVLAFKTNKDATIPVDRFRWRASQLPGIML